jgi:type IX secretion system PorP/SprF family membrane protein
MKRLAIIIGLLAGVVFTGQAQQREHYSQYVFNNYLLNPAVGGSYSFWNIKAGHRNQWVNLEGTPKTYFLSAHGPINYPDPRVRTKRKRPHHGVGGYIYHDVTGPISWNGAYASYAFHHKINHDFSYSLGIAGGAKVFQLDADKLKFVQVENDQLIAPGVTSTLIPDANAGVFVYSKYMFFGASMHQILRSNLKLQSVGDLQSNAELSNHYFATFGYKAKMGRDLAFYPSVMLKVVSPAPVSMDVNLRFLYTDDLWLAATYRHGDALSFMAEYVIGHVFEVGYAFDLTLTEIQRYSRGTHEIIVGYRWHDSAKQGVCPAKFW